MRGFLLLLGLAHFFSGVLPTLSPLVMMSLFDSALPSKSAYSVVALAAIAVYFAIAEWAITSLVKNHATSFVQKSRAIPLTAESKMPLVLLIKGHYWASGSAFWTALTLGALWFFIPLAGGLLTTACLVTALFGYFGGLNSTSLMLKVFPTGVLFFVAYLVVTGDITVGALFAVMYLSGRSVQNFALLGEALSHFKRAQVSADAKIELDYAYQTVYPFGNKHPFVIVCISLALLGSLIALLETPIDRVLATSGVSVAQSQNLEVKANQSGILSKVFVKEGDEVFEGRVLAKVETYGDQQIDLLKSQLKELEEAKQNSTLLSNEVVSAQRDALRVKRAQKKKGLISQDELLTALTQVSEAELSQATAIFQFNSRINEIRSRIFDAETRIKSGRLSAPSAGEIQQGLAVSEGSTINQGDVLFTIVPDSNIIVEAKFPFIHRSFLQEGQVVILEQATPGTRKPKQEEGTISRVAPLLGDDGDSLSVTIKPNSPLKTGQSFQVIVPLDRMKIKQWLTVSLRSYVEPSFF